jgi:hypothetical protein
MATFVAGAAPRLRKWQFPESAGLEGVAQLRVLK